MPELRKDWISGQWVAFSSERLRRPQVFSTPDTTTLDSEADPFAEGNESFTPPEVYAVRPGGSAPNTPGWKVRVVPNRYPALRVEGELLHRGDGIYDHISGVGAHEVVIESPHANCELESHSLHHFSMVLETYRARTLDLMRDQRLRYLSVFKNSGQAAGASQSHAHSQIIALPVVPSEAVRRITLCEEHYCNKERCLFDDVIAQEKRDASRIVLENDAFVAVCPYASRFPFELRLIPKKKSCHYFSSTDRTLVQCAEMLKKILGAYRHGLNRPAYNLMIHTAPLPHRGGTLWPHIEKSYRWHIELFPRIFGIAGFELSTGCALNAVYPEEAARFLRQTIENLPEEKSHE
ncbi:MAG: DUF4931 domain-containing protein [Candidatus Methylacidiphilales bacterium]